MNIYGFIYSKAVQARLKVRKHFISPLNKINKMFNKVHTWSDF